MRLHHSALQLLSASSTECEERNEFPSLEAPEATTDKAWSSWGHWEGSLATELISAVIPWRVHLQAGSTVPALCSSRATCPVMRQPPHQFYYYLFF